MRSLTVKLTLAFLLVGIAGVLLVAFIVGARTQRGFDQFVHDRYQSDLVDELLDHYRQNGGWQDISAIVAQGRGHGPMPPVPVTLLDADHRVVYSLDYPRGEQLAPRQTNNEIALEVDGETVGWLLPAPRLARRLLAGSPEARFLASVRQALLFGVLGACALALLLGGLLAQTLTRPLRELTAATHALAQGALGQQVTIRSQDELGELAAAFNQMSTDLARSVHLRRQMTADIAHDLRTPLSVILGYTEALHDRKLAGEPEIYAVLHDEARLLNGLIDDLRTLSLADAGELPLRRERLAPAALIERAALAHRVQAGEKQITLTVDAQPNLPPVEADPERMAQVLGNLMSNALRYTPEGGQVRLAASADAAQVTLQVQDSGPGIAPEELPNVFERFYRGDKSRHQHSSSGLGLAIAKSLVEMQGGAIAVTSTPGQGATFTVTLPPAAG
jgi:signal transduction histidine kinase